MKVLKSTSFLMDFLLGFLFDTECEDIGYISSRRRALFELRGITTPKTVLFGVILNYHQGWNWG
jgi:hypothetical protein